MDLIGVFFSTLCSVPHRSRPEYDLQDSNKPTRMRLAPTDSLLLCIRQRDWDATRLRLVTYPFDVQYRPRSGNRATALHVALMHRAPHDVVAMLVDSFPPALFIQDSEGWTPLHVNILYGGDPKTTMFLIQRGGFAAASMHSEFVGSPLHLACRHGSSSDVLRELIQTNPEQVTVPNATGATPGILLYKTFLRHHNVQDEYHASRLAEQLYIMLAATTQEPRNETPSLHQVIEFQKRHADDSDFVGLILKLDPDSPTRISNGRLPLHTAASFNYKHSKMHSLFPDASPSDPLVLLLEHSPATASRVDAMGRLPLHIALETGRQWDTGVQLLVQTFPESLTRRDTKSALFPFQIAAHRDEIGAVETGFRLLLACPQVMESRSRT